MNLPLINIFVIREKPATTSSTPTKSKHATSNIDYWMELYDASNMEWRKNFYACLSCMEPIGECCCADAHTMQARREIVEMEQDEDWYH